MVVLMHLDDDAFNPNGSPSSLSLNHPDRFSHSQPKPVWTPPSDTMPIINEQGMQDSSQPVTGRRAQKQAQYAWQEQEQHRANLNLNGFSASLSCYPVVCQMASHLDLNDLHSLSRTCRQFRANLLEFRSHLIARSLHCEFERSREELGRPLKPGRKDSHGSLDPLWFMPRGFAATTCARDLVAECRKCGIVVCRNCTAKSPAQSYLKMRHRRLCRTCIHAPLENHLQPNHSQASKTPSSPTHSSTSPSTSPSRPSRFPQLDQHAFQTPPSFTSSAHLRNPCTCPTTLHLCLPCGAALRSNDTIYARGWAWRTRYCTYLGGLGTGIGEGNEGVECGRGSGCLAAKVVEQEVACDEVALANEQGGTTTTTMIYHPRYSSSGSSSSAGNGHGNGHSSTSPTENPHIPSPSPSSRPFLAEPTERYYYTASPLPTSPSPYHRPSTGGGGFHVQEIEGIGGAVKRKAKRLVRVGQYVEEHVDEREKEGLLAGGEAGLLQSQTQLQPAGGSSSSYAHQLPQQVQGATLEREMRGLVRSWCAWCERVVPASGEGVA